MSFNLTMTDLFCGAGGSSTGATAFGGIDVKIAANHWKTALETHNANHPNTLHVQANISETDPRAFPTTDILWGSPECTNHSRAKGRKAPTQPDLFGEVLPDEAAERSRATMWDIVRFAEAHHYRAIVVENVVEVTDWSSAWGVKGGLFTSWLQAMHVMGYAHHIVSLNSMHAQAFGLPAPQSRDRVYICFWREGERRPDFEQMLRPKAWCPSCDEVVSAMQSWKKPGTIAGRYRQQYIYRCPKHSCRGQIVEPAWLPASSIIDWSLPGTRIGDRAKPLADKTLRRIQLGIERYWMPILTETANPYDSTDPKHRQHGNPDAYIRSWPLVQPTQTMHTRESKALAYLPVMVPVEGRDGKMPFTAAQAMRAQTTRNETGMAMPPFLTQFRERVRDLDPNVEPLPTVVADGANHALITSYYSRDDAVREASDPLATVTTEPRHALLVPAGGTWNDDARPDWEAMRARTTRESEGLVFPPFIAELRGGGSTARDAREALATVTASGNHHALIHRMNEGGAEMTTPAGEPIRTLTTAGHQALLQGGTINVEDVNFRMLEPHEIKQAMAFPKDYIMVGNRREQVKQSGNAVTPPAARDLVAVMTAAITGEGVAA